MPLSDRIAALESFAAFLQQHLEACAEVLSMEVGKPLQQARNEVNGACARIAWLTANASKYLSEEWMVTEGGTKEKSCMSHLVWFAIFLPGTILTWLEQMCLYPPFLQVTQSYINLLNWLPYRACKFRNTYMKLGCQKTLFR